MLDIQGHLLLRFNNVAFVSLPGAAAQELMQTAVELHQLSQWRQSRKQALCDRLYEAFARASDKEASRPLLNLKRDIFGDRDTKVPAALALALCPDDELAEWYRGRARGTQLAALLEPLYQEGLRSERQRLQQQLAHPRFQQACIVSSASLYDAVRSYTGTPVEQHDGRRRKMEYSLLQYLTRATVRTSPYSFYTSVGFGVWEEGGGAGSLPLRVPPARTAQVEANHAVMRRLLEALARRPELAAHLEYRLAQGLRVSEGRLSFEFSVDDPVNQPRVFGTTQKRGSLPLTATLVALRKWLESSPAGSRPYAAIVDSLATAVRGASREQVLSFVESLISAGLLRPVIPVPEQTTCITTAASAFLRQVPGELVQRAAASLEEISRTHESLPDLGASARAGALQGLGKSWQTAFELVGAQVPANTPLLYEDTALPGVLRVGREPWAQSLEDLRTLVGVLDLFDPAHLLKPLVSEEFVKRHGVGGVCTDIDSFIECVPQLYTRWFEVALRGVPEELSGRFPYLETLRTLKAKFNAHLFSRLEEGEEIRLGQDFLRELAAGIPPELTADWAAYSAFVQPEVGQGQVQRLVINHLYNGLGQYSSRFLPLLGEEALSVVRRCIDDFFPRDHLVAGLRPVVGFNANLHPELARIDAELDGTAGPGKLGLGELVLVHDAATNRVMLRRGAEGQPATMLYSGFLITYLLPPKLSFLTSLGGNGPLTFSFHSSADNKLGAQRRKQIRHFPRVSHGRVVLFRRRWNIPAALIPRPGPAESEAAYFARVNQWRLEQGIPEECFLRSSGEAEQVMRPEDWARQLAQTREKPQYLDFRSSLLVRLLAKWLRDNERAELVLEEMLPSVSRSPLESPEGRHATEVIVELSRGREGWTRR